MTSPPTQLELSYPFRTIKRRVIWLLGAFSLLLAFFAANSLQERLDQRRLAVQVRNWTELTSIISQAIHELQRERGLSSSFLSTDGQRFFEPLAVQTARTDAALLKLAKALPSHGVAIPNWSVADLATTTGTVRMREEVRELRVTRNDAVAHYSGLINQLIAAMLNGTATAGDLVGQQMAFISLLRARETAGLERALVVAVLSSGTFNDQPRITYLHQLRAIQDTQLEQFRSLAAADANANAGYREIETADYMREIDAFRRYVIAEGRVSERTSTSFSAERWFDVASQRIDAMKALEDGLGAALLDQAHARELDAERQLFVNGLSALMSFLFGGMLLWFVRRGKEQAESRLRLAEKVFSNSVESILVTDPDCRIIEVNAAFTQISGYSRAEVLGQHVRLMNSGRHDPDFYKTMWQRIGSDGNWKGEIWNRRKNGDIYPALLSIVAVRSPAGAVINYIAMTADLSQHKKTEALLEQLRTFDALTGMLSRDAWVTALDLAIANTRGSTRRFAVLEIGLDRFKLINDSLSHAVGDYVLTETAERIRRVLRRHDVAARPGGDRFSVLLEDIESAQNVGAICEKLLAAFVPPIDVDGHRLHVSASIGVALFPDDGEGAAALMRQAEAAMYRAKEDGRATYHFYSDGTKTEGAQLLTLEAMLRQALVRNEFSVVYQPQVHLESGCLVGVEALLRWTNPELGAISPVQFIPIAEETGIIVPIGNWVLHTACAQARAWQQRYGVSLPVAVNLSARQFTNKNLMTDIQKALDESGIRAGDLELEITEGSLIEDPASAVDILRGLRAMGVRTAIDDFGTGYSSLAYLKHFPLDRLKIDRAFVRDLPHDESDVAITRAVVALGRNLNMEILAEGVEETVQEQFLAEIGCHVIQGYLHGKPMSAAEIEHRIDSGLLNLLLLKQGQEKAEC